MGEVQAYSALPGLTISLLGITTEADRKLDVSLDKIGGKGLFVKELEEALYDGRADLAVHSMKDLPMELPPGLILASVCEREDPRDAFVSINYPSLFSLPLNAKLGTSSLRRQTQLLHLRSDLDIYSLRGNVNTRLKRLVQGEFDAIVLAAAGLKRMQLLAHIKAYFKVEEILPAAGQGALGLECREEDEQLLALIRPLNNEKAATCVKAERALCRRLQGGCMVPIGAYAEIHKDRLHLRGLVADGKGTRIIRAEEYGKPSEAEQIGHQAAERLLQQGALSILQAFRDH